MKSTTPRKIAVPYWVLYCVVAACGLMAHFLSNPSGSVPIQGGCSASIYPAIKEPAYVDSAITICQKGNADQMQVESDWLRDGRYLEFSYIGYPETKNEQLFLVDSTGMRLDLHLRDAGERWRSQIFEVPRSMRQHSYRLVAADLSSLGFGWIGIGRIRSISLPFDLAGLFEMVAILLALQIAASVAVSYLTSFFSSVTALLVFPMIFGLLGYGAFWTFVLHRYVGFVFTFLFCGALAYLCARCWRKEFRMDIANRQIFLATAFSLLVLWAAFYPLGDVFVSAAGERWQTLVTDNVVPMILADQLRIGHLMRPMVGDWHASDRPPLQAGIYLLWPIPDRLCYQVLATWLQASSLIALCLLVRSTGSRFFRAGALLLLAAGALYLQNAAFTWPKLLAASYTTIAYILIFSLGGCDLAPRVRAVAIGAALSMSLLAHGGAVFALPGIIVCALVWRGMPAWKNAFACLAVSALLLTPWTLFQKFVDPPGDRLLKWHLAGLVEPRENISFATAWKEAYSHVTFDQWLSVKAHGLWLTFGGSYQFPIDLAGFFSNPRFDSQTLFQFSQRSFEGSAYVLWFLAPAFCIALACALFLRSRRQNPRDLHHLLVSSAISLLAWILVLFQRDGAVVHQGAYFNNIALSVAASWVVYNFARHLYCAVVAGNIVLLSMTYLPLRLANENRLAYWAGLTFLFAGFTLSCWLAAKEDTVDAVSA